MVCDEHLHVTSQSVGVAEHLITRSNGLLKTVNVIMASETPTHQRQCIGLLKFRKGIGDTRVFKRGRWAHFRVRKWVT